MALQWLTVPVVRLHHDLGLHKIEIDVIHSSTPVMTMWKSQYSNWVISSSMNACASAFSVDTIS